MSQNTYEYECMRAELLGIEKPNYEEFIKNHPEEQIAEEEEIDTENLKELDSENGSLKNVSGGLDELNTILKATQRKLHNFKASACGSLTNIFRSRSNSIQEAMTENPTETTPKINNEKPPENIENPPTEEGSPQPRKSDLSKALDKHVDTLDSLIEKAENAQYSMAHQTKQMKHFLNK